MEFFAKENSRPSAKQLQSILRRLERLFLEYHQQAKRLKIILERDDLLSVIDTALLETEGQTPRLAWPDTVKGFFLGGIYEDLIQQPSNIFETVTHEDGQSYYVPLKSEVWRLCLEKFRTTV